MTEPCKDRACTDECLKTCSYLNYLVDCVLEEGKVMGQVQEGVKATFEHWINGKVITGIVTKVLELDGDTYAIVDAGGKVPYTVSIERLRVVE